MPQVVTTNALILCPHWGKGTTVPTNPKWQVSGGVVVLENDTGVLACPFLPNPCTGYRLQSMGLNATWVDGRRVILATDFNQTFTNLPLSIVEFHQTFDETTLTPIPPGQPAPPPAPALADLVKPVVTTPARTLPPYSIMSHAPLTVTFSLFNAFPLRWILTLIDESLGPRDLTQGIPGSVTVMPPGGQWSTPSLTVTVAMTPVFLAGLTPTKLAHFFMTGVSQRGLSDNAEAMLPVTP